MILDISKKLNDKKEMDQLGAEYKDGIVVIDGDNYKTLFGKRVYPAAMVANMQLHPGERTYKLACGGFVNLTNEEWQGEWNDRLMAPPDNYKEPTFTDTMGAPVAAYQMFSKEPETCKK